MGAESVDGSGGVRDVGGAGRERDGGGVEGAKGDIGDGIVEGDGGAGTCAVIVEFRRKRENAEKNNTSRAIYVSKTHFKCWPEWGNWSCIIYYGLVEAVVMPILVWHESRLRGTSCFVSHIYIDKY